MTERELIDDILSRIEQDGHGYIDWIDDVGRGYLAAPLEAANKTIRELEREVGESKLEDVLDAQAVRTENTALREAVRVLAVAASLGNDLSMYAASSRVDNTPEFVEGLMEECEAVQGSFGVAANNDIARAAIEAAQKEPQ